MDQRNLCWKRPLDSLSNLSLISASRGVAKARSTAESKWNALGLDLGYQRGQEKERDHGWTFFAPGCSKGNRRDQKKRKMALKRTSLEMKLPMILEVMKLEATQRKKEIMLSAQDERVEIRGRKDPRKFPCHRIPHAKKWKQTVCLGRVVSSQRYLKQ